MLRLLETLIYAKFQDLGTSMNYVSARILPLFSQLPWTQIGLLAGFPLYGHGLMIP